METYAEKLSDIANTAKRNLKKVMFLGAKPKR